MTEIQIFSESSAKELGQALQAAREASGYTVERASVATRISLGFIHSLERGELTKLPGAVFAKGFIRNLCRCYNIDSQSMVALFDRSTQETEEPAPVSKVVKVEAALAPEPVAKPTPVVDAPPPIQAVEHEPAVTPPVPGKRSKMGLAIAVAMGLIVGVWITMKQVMTPDQGPIVADPVTTTVPPDGEDAAVTENEGDKVAVEAEPQAEPHVETAQTVAPAAAPIPQATPEPAAEVKPKVVAKAEHAEAREHKPSIEAAPAPKKAAVVVVPPTNGRGKQIIQVNARSRVVIRLTMDGGPQQTLTLEPRQHQFEFADRANMLIFDAGSVDVKFNGRPLGDLGKKGRIRRLSFQNASVGQSAKL